MPPDTGSTRYIVTWTIDIYADSPQEAAREALAIQKDPNAVFASWFRVINPETGDVWEGEV